MRGAFLYSKCISPPIAWYSNSPYKKPLVITYNNLIFNSIAMLWERCWWKRTGTHKHTNVLVVSDIFGHFAVYSTFGAKYEQRVSTV